LVSCSNDGMLLLWDLKIRTNDSMLKIKGHKSAIVDCRISDDEKNIASVDVEGNIIITKISD